MCFAGWDSATNCRWVALNNNKAPFDDVHFRRAISMAANRDAVVKSAIFGEGSGLSRLVYALVGLSALYQIVPLLKAFQLDEPHAEAAHR